MTSFTIRPAIPADAPLVLEFIKKLAVYEKLASSVTGTLEDLNETLFGAHPVAYALLGEEEGHTVGFAIYFHNYSTFLCRPGIYIEDIYVDEAYRGRGYGRAFFREICKLAEAKRCGRVEWWCLDWNKPSIDFYTKTLGAEAMTEWTVYRLDREKIGQLARG